MNERRARNHTPIPRSHDAEVLAGDDDRWASRLVGIFFVVLAFVNLAGPVLPYFRESTRVIFGIFGAPMMIRGVPDLLWSLGEGATFLLVGIGILRNWRSAFFVGMLLGVRMIYFGGPSGWVFGTLSAVALWGGLPRADCDVTG